MMKVLYISASLLCCGAIGHIAHSADIPAPSSGYKEISERITKAGLGSGKAHHMLTELCTKVGPRLSGSEGAAKGIAWAKSTMEAMGLENVRLEPVMVPHWVRGPIESAVAHGADTGVDGRSLSVCALGGSVGTSEGGITAGVLEVRSNEELVAAKDKAKGKVIFFNRAFDPTHFDTGRAYGGSNGQRAHGAVEAAKVGGVAAIVRSMTQRRDDRPHTGAMYYSDTVPKVPAAAISTVGAEWLSSALKTDPNLKITLKLSCETLPDVPSANVVGEIVGSQFPEQVVVIGGHLDSWDKGQGAHDDGAGCVHCLEAVRLLKELGLRPKRTIRVVMFINEENGLRGGLAYAAAKRPGESHVAAIESDAGGFQPRGFGVGGSQAVFDTVSKWLPYFEPIEVDRFRKGGGGADIGPLMEKGVPGFGLLIDGQKYFDVHHSDNDTIEAVHERELEFGSIAMALMSYLLANEGLPAQPTQAN